MGVQGLWQLLHPAGKPVSPSSLEGKVLAVDVSIWLHQTMKGMRDKDGNPLPNAHLQGLFSRVCKLLFYRIRPVFVFDGGVPALKKQTLAIRRERKENTVRERGRLNQKLLQNLMQMHVMQDLTGVPAAFTDHRSKRTEPDLYQLPPLPQVDKGSKDPVDNSADWEAESDWYEESSQLYDAYQNNYQNLDDIDFESAEFHSLPAEIRHEILTEMKEQRKENALARIAIMPEESEDFSDYQLKKLIKQSRLTGKIESIRKEMNQRMSGDITYALGDDYSGELVEVNRVVSEDAAHYVLIKGLTRRQQVAEAERCKARRLKFREKSEFKEEPEDDAMETVHPEEKTLEQEGPEKICDSVKMETDVKIQMLDRKIVSDGEASEEAVTKNQRRAKRGKALLTRKGVRNVAKKGKARPCVPQVKVSDDDDADLVDVTSLDQEMAPAVNSSAVKCEALQEDDKCDESPIVMATGEGTYGSFISTKSKTDQAVKRTESSSSLQIVSDKENDISKNDAKEVDVRDESFVNSSSSSRTPYNIGDEVFQTSKIHTSHQPAPSVMETDFTALQEKMLKEEEELSKAKDEKMAALMKALEKRAQILKGPQANAVSSSADPQETPKKLLKQEMLTENKEAKMGTLTESHIQSGYDIHETIQDGDDNTSGKRICNKDENDAENKKGQSLSKKARVQKSNNDPNENSSKEKESHSSHIMDSPDTKVNKVKNKSKTAGKRRSTKGASQNMGFLEEVADLERRRVERKTRGRSARQAAAEQSLPSSESLQAPALTIDYLEDVESMLEMDDDINQKSVGGDFISTSREESSQSAQSQTATAFEEILSEELSNQELMVTSSKSKRSEISNRVKGNESTLEISPTNPVTDYDISDDDDDNGDELRIVSSTKRGVKGTANVSAKAGKRCAVEFLEGGMTKKERKMEEQPAELQQVVDDGDDSEDEGFIEVTIDPSKMADDDELFPANIFTTDPPPANANNSHRQTRKESDPNDKEHRDFNDDNGDGVEEIPGKVRQTVGDSRKMSVEDMAAASFSPRFGHLDNSSNGDKLSIRSSSIEEEEEKGNGIQRERTVSADDKAENFTKGVTSLTDLYNIQRDLNAERYTLTMERGRQARLGKSITEQVNLEAQELLQLFGVPFVVSPMEAEAQCAQLELLGMTQGTITDDSDAWLFGASHVYKNFFNQTKYVEFYTMDAVQRHFSLDRHQLINVALLCGSDYTPGIPGVGPVRAIEIMAEFPGEELEGLQSFREWWEDARDGVLPRNQGKVKNKLRTLDIHDGFPSRQVVEAYLHPEVDDSDEPFTWSLPDVELLRQFAKKKFGWGKEKVDEVLNPMMKELTKKAAQGRIHSYFQPENFLPPKPVKSKRLQKALDKFRDQGSSQSESESESESSSGSESEEPELPEIKTGESIIEKANQILSGATTRGRGRGSGGRGRGSRGQGMKRGKDGTQTSVVKARSGSGRGKGQGEVIGRGQGQRKEVSARGKPLRLPVKGKAPPKGLVLRDEVCLSESSSDSDNEDHRDQKPKTVPKKSDANPRVPGAKSSRGKRISNATPNVKKLTPSFSRKSAVVKQKKSTQAVTTGNLAAVKEALGGDIDPMKMTLNDLGSDFSDGDF